MSLILLWLASWVFASLWTSYAHVNVERSGEPTFWNRLACNLVNGGQLQIMSGSEICVVPPCPNPQVRWKCVKHA